MARTLKLGDRVRLKLPAARMLAPPARPTGTYLYDGRAIMDGADLTDVDDDGFLRDVMAADWEWSKLRDQTPNPEHARFVEYWRKAFAADAHTTRAGAVHDAHMSGRSNEFHGRDLLTAATTTRADETPSTEVDWGPDRGGEVFEWNPEPEVTAVEIPGGPEVVIIAGAIRQALVDYEAANGAPMAVMLAVVGVENTPASVCDVTLTPVGRQPADLSSILFEAMQMHMRGKEAQAFARRAYTHPQPDKGH